MRSTFELYIDIRYTEYVIQSIKGQLTQDIFDGKNSKESRKFDQGLHAIARRKLDQLNAAAKLDDLKVPPGNRSVANCISMDAEWT